MASYTVYPDKIDNASSLPVAIDNIAPVKPETINRIRSAVLAIESELGINPKGNFGTVDDRLNKIEETLSDLSEQIEKIQIANGSSLRIKNNGKTVNVAATTLDFIGSNISINQFNGTSTVKINDQPMGLSEQLKYNNLTSGNNIVISSGDNIVLTDNFSMSFTDDSSYIGANIKISAQNGIEGGNIVLAPGKSDVGQNGSLIVESEIIAKSISFDTTNKYLNRLFTIGNGIYYADDIGEVKRLFNHSYYGPFVGLTGVENTNVCIPNSDGKGCFIIDPSKIDDRHNASFNFYAVLETTNKDLPAEIFLYNLTDDCIVPSFEIPLTTNSLTPILLCRNLVIEKDLPIKETLYQVHIRFLTDKVNSCERVTCRLAEVRVE